MLGSISAIAVPNFTQFIRNNQVQAKTEELHAFLQYARSQAVASRRTYKVDLRNWQVINAEDKVERRLENTNSDLNLVLAPDSPNTIDFDGRGMVKDAKSATINVFHSKAPNDGFVIEVRASCAVRKNKAG